MRDEDYKGNILKDFIEDRKYTQVTSLFNNKKSLLDADILELILSSTHTDLAISPIMIARNLIDTFGSIGKVFSSELYNLKSIKGLNNDSIITILCIKEALTRMSRETITKSPIILNNKKALIDYLRVSIGHVGDKECLQVIYMNQKHRIISESVEHGTLNQVVIYPREIIKHALATGSYSIVIAHNHTSDDPSPSYQDTYETLRLFKVCSILNMELVDHIIITPGSYFSFREKGILPLTT